MVGGVSPEITASELRRHVSALSVKSKRNGGSKEKEGNHLVGAQIGNRVQPN